MKKICLAATWLPKIAGVFLLLIIFISLAVYFLEPNSSPLEVTVSNVTNSQISLSWVTKSPTRGAVVVSENGQFPLLPIFIANLQKDDGEKNLKTMRLYLTHHVTIADLKPDKIYRFRIYQGLRQAGQGSFQTGSSLSSLSVPNPVYGRVVKADGKTPAVGVLVYLSAATPATTSALLSIITNTSGRWSLDLANLRSSDFQKGFLLPSQSKEILVVNSGQGKKALVEVKLGRDKPWPDVVLK